MGLVKPASHCHCIIAMEQNVMNNSFSHPAHRERSPSFLKETVLLAFGLFLAAAPSPNIAQLAELTAGFISGGLV